MAEACRALDFPVVSGNVSLYNETNGAAIPPTPTVGGVGLLPDYARRAGYAGLREGDALLLVGDSLGALGASLYLRECLGREDGAPPPVDLATERCNGDFVRGLIRAGVLTAVHDLSDGGLVMAAAEMALAANLGLVLDADHPNALAIMFGEDQARYLIGAGNAEPIIAEAKRAGVAIARIGRAGGDALVASGLFSIPLSRLREAHEGWMPAYMGESLPPS
jgi:phosphoribosylformylglycinamidine synthase